MGVYIHINSMGVIKLGDSYGYDMMMEIIQRLWNNHCVENLR